jgi:hypothetical protein
VLALRSKANKKTSLTCLPCFARQTQRLRWLVARKPSSSLCLPCEARQTQRNSQQKGGKGCAYSTPLGYWILEFIATQQPTPLGPVRFASPNRPVRWSKPDRPLLLNLWLLLARPLTPFRQRRGLLRWSRSGRNRPVPTGRGIGVYCYATTFGCCVAINEYPARAFGEKECTPLQRSEGLLRWGCFAGAGPRWRGLLLSLRVIGVKNKLFRWRKKT